MKRHAIFARNAAIKSFAVPLHAIDAKLDWIWIDPNAVINFISVTQIV